MDELRQRIEDIQESIEKSKREYERFSGAAEATEKKFNDVFGVSDLPTAKKKLIKLKKDFEKDLTDFTARLEAFEHKYMESEK